MERSASADRCDAAVGHSDGNQLQNASSGDSEGLSCLSESAGELRGGQGSKRSIGKLNRFNYKNKYLVFNQILMFFITKVEVCKSLAICCFAMCCTINGHMNCAKTQVWLCWRSVCL